MDEALKRYLEAELRRYFPHAALIDLGFAAGGEVIDVRIIGPMDEEDQFPAYITHLRFEAGSDDDCYEFKTDHDNVYTVPLMPETTEVVVSIPEDEMRQSHDRRNESCKALFREVLDRLIEAEQDMVRHSRDTELWTKAKERADRHRQALTNAYDHLLPAWVSK